MIVFFVTERLAFGSKVRLNRHIEKLRELGITHVIDVRNYPQRADLRRRRRSTVFWHHQQRNPGTCDPCDR
jgi:hypothetical protein